jgi:hypothetical protein
VQVQGSAGVSDLEPAGQQSAQAAPEPTPAAEPIADDINQPAAAVATTGQAERSADIARNEAASELPRTASPLPLSALIGLLSLGSALGLRCWRR